MAIDYDSLAQTASTLIGDNGRASVYIRSTTAGTSNPVAGTVTAGTVTDTACNGIVVKYDEKYMPGATVEIGDMFLVPDARARLQDQLLIGGAVYQIVNVWPIVPGDTFLACRVQVRGTDSSAVNNTVIDTSPDAFYVVNSGEYVVNSGTQVIST